MQKNTKSLKELHMVFIKCMCKNLIREISGTEANKVSAKICKVVEKQNLVEFQFFSF